MSAVRVAVVGASAVWRGETSMGLQVTDPGQAAITVVGDARGPTDAEALVAGLSPDVVVLDLPADDDRGPRSVEHLMGFAPVPILGLCRSTGGQHRDRGVAALVAGAADVLPCPTDWRAGEGLQVRRRVRSLRGVTVLRHPRARLGAPRAAAAPAGRRRVVGLAASTGGPPALVEVLQGLGGVDAPILVVQHLHADFVQGLVAWLRRACPLPVALARHGEPLVPGAVRVAPAGRHLRIGTDGRLALAATPKQLHMPAADELFASMAAACGSHGIGVVLTGMGADGARGLQLLAQAGGTTIAQDEATSAVYGMPRAARDAGAASQVLPLDQIARAVVRAVRSGTGS